jgi:Pentapeptide repeats (9 copies)
MSDTEKPPLRPANDNPWYCLATLYGEQAVKGYPAKGYFDIDDLDLAAKNRVAWNRWMAAGLSDDERAKLVKKGFPEAELVPLTPAEKSAFCNDFASRAGRAKMSLPEPTDVVDFTRTHFDNLVFLDGFLYVADANFNSATFSGRADFRSATFSGRADFGSATFSGRADFGSATFCGDATFRSATFSDRADFESAKFSRDADFGSATFSGRAEFASATFSSGDFRSATFSNDAHFASATFSGNAHFESATFSFGATFESATFSGDAHFGSATFSFDTTFGSAKFSCDANFWSATFSRSTGFIRATFSGFTTFGLAKFSGFATLGLATFSSDVHFASATFSGDANFYSATFLAEADFRSAIFSKNTDFGSATFSEDASFESATFSGYADFELVTFSKKAVFINAGFAANTVFGHARFGTRVPDFRGAKMHEATEWHGVSWPPAPKDKDAAQAQVYGYERLRQEMERLNKHEDEQFFFGKELRARRGLVRHWSGAWLLNYLYEASSSYGQSVARPLFWLFGLLAIGAAFFAGAPVFNGTRIPIPRAAGVSFANIFSFLPIKREIMTAEMIAGLSSAAQIVGVVQSLLGVVLLFLLGLALRSRFRMR